ncbi:MAG: ATP-binding protein, partial [Actinomycetota bacterium]|nr:ATP-binding protein [Actinomycetota bacterium]
MVSLRSRRLEASFGAALSDVTAQHVLELVAGAVHEDFDLDFKAQMYGNGDAEKRDLAADVAAMANSAGGVIVLGVEENEHAQAVAAPGIAISDEVERRIFQVTAGISPVPPIAVRRIPLDASDSGRGFVLVIVPRSLSAPHAVVVNATSLRYPVRHGTTTRYLTAPEVSAAYRQRL